MFRGPLSMIEHAHQMDVTTRLCAPNEISLESNSVQILQNSFGQDYNRWFPEITGEIIRKSGRTSFWKDIISDMDYWHIYIGPFQNGGGSQKALVCDSIRPSGMNIYYTGLPDACYVLETLLFLFFTQVLWSFWQGHMWCVRLEWQTDWIDCERSLFTPCSWLRRNVKKSSVASAASSVVLHGLPEADHCEQRIEYRTRNSEASSIPSLTLDCG